MGNKKKSGLGINEIRDPSTRNIKIDPAVINDVTHLVGKYSVASVGAALACCIEPIIYDTNHIWTAEEVDHAIEFQDFLSDWFERVPVAKHKRNPGQNRKD